MLLTLSLLYFSAMYSRYSLNVFPPVPSHNRGTLPHVRQDPQKMGVG